MSGVINKVKDAVTGHHSSEDTTTTHGSANNGPHNSKLANKLDPRVDNSRDYTTPGAAGSETTTTAHPVTSGTKATNAGPHDSNMMNKADPRVDSDRDNRARHAEMGGAHGPHKSDMMNKADPRVDSDRDNRAAGGLYSGTTPKAPGSGLPGKSSTSDPVEEEQHVKPAGFTPHTDDTTTRTFSMSQNESAGSTNHGPHKSNMMNKMDPRVDSDRDGRARHETVGSGGLNSSTAGTGYGHTGSVGSTGTTGTTHSIYSSNTGAGSTNHGTHNSNMMNKMDPRFDSDRDNRARHETVGAGGLSSGGLSSGGLSSGTGTTGTTGMGTTDMGTTSTNHGTHNSNIMNKMDPRFDSDLDNRARHEALGQTGYNTTGNTYNTTTPAGSSYNTPGMGSTKTTAGPHDSNLMNKMDPRVDSDLDNRQTVGTHGTHSVGGTQRGYGL